MAIVVTEKYKGRRRDAQSAEIVYLVIGTEEDAGNVTDEDAFTAAASSVPETWDGLSGANIDVRDELIQNTIWEVAALYGTNEPTVYQQSTVEYEFSYHAPSAHIFQSLLTRGAYSEDGEEDANMYGGALRVTDNDGTLEVEGLDLPGGSPTNTFIYKPLHASITTAYQMAVESLCGAVSLYPFMGRPERTMRLVSVDGGAVFAAGINPKWAIRFGFEHSANSYNVPVGDITVPFKAGHDVIWAQYEDRWVDFGNRVVKKPILAFVEQIFPEMDFSPLGIS